MQLLLHHKEHGAAMDMGQLFVNQTQPGVPGAGPNPTQSNTYQLF